MAQSTRLLSPVAALALALIPVSLSGQAPTSARDEVVWHWFGDCAGRDSLVLEVSLDGKSLYRSVFPICRVRRRQIKPEPQEQLLEFRFVGVPRRFGTRYRATEPEPIQGTVWESGGGRDAILLGVSFAADQQVLLNMHHTARVGSESRSERTRGLVITTRPVQRSNRTPPEKPGRPEGSFD
jgi:hypothetical protein